MYEEIAYQTTEKFYRVEINEIVGDVMSYYVFYILPESLDNILDMFKDRKDRWLFGEPQLVDVTIIPPTTPGGFAQAKGETARHFLIGG